MESSMIFEVDTIIYFLNPIEAAYERLVCSLFLRYFTLVLYNFCPYGVETNNTSELTSRMIVPSPIDAHFTILHPVFLL
jgi:hypothetical protein